MTPPATSQVMRNGELLHQVQQGNVVILWGFRSVSPAAIFNKGTIKSPAKHGRFMGIYGGFIKIYGDLWGFKHQTWLFTNLNMGDFTMTNDDENHGDVITRNGDVNPLRSTHVLLVYTTISVCLKMGYTPNYSHLVGIMIINHWV